jgi:hypothetical protein
MTTDKRTVVLYRSGIATAFVAALLGSLACSEEATDDQGGIIGTPTAGSGTGVGAQPGAGASTGSGGTGIVVPGTGGGSATAGASGNGGLEACATGMAKADLTPVNMFIQFDRSGSMLDDDKWAQAAEALNAFFADPATQGLKVALRFFPHDSPVAGCTGGNNGACDIDSCATPLVGLGELLGTMAPADMQESLLIQAVNSATPDRGGGNQSGGTPIYPALAGALNWAAANQIALPNERTVVVLVTDGEPNGCDTNIGNIARLSSAALANNGIPTYAIGIAGASEDQMNEIAQAGGTQEAFFAGNTMTAQQDLVNALNAIRGTVLSCAFPLPQGSNVDPNKVNIRFTPSAGVEQGLAQAMNAAACSTAGGWYYDNPTAPTQITLCPATCDVVQADSAGRLDVVLGCATMVR